MWNLKKFLTSAERWKSTGSNISQTYIQTYSIMYKQILNRFNHIISKNYKAKQ